MQKLLLAVCPPVFEVEGQSNTDPAISPIPRTINLTAEQRFIIKEICSRI